MKKIIVVGAGAAGIIAAIAAKSGENKAADVALYEKNEKIGKKLFISASAPPDFTGIMLYVILRISVTTSSMLMLVVSIS